MQDLLIAVNLVPLIRVDEIGHGGDAGIILIRFRLLRVERVDVGFHEHRGEDEILQDLNALKGARFVVVLEAFEKVALGFFPVF